MRERGAFWGRAETPSGARRGPHVQEDHLPPRPQTLGMRREPRAPNLTERAASSDPTHPMPLTALMYMLSCSFTEQFMGMPVTCDNTLGEGLASPEPQGHRPTPLSLARSRGRVLGLICLCPGVPSPRPKPQKVNLCFPDGFFVPDLEGAPSRAGLSLDGKILPLPICPPRGRFPEQDEVFPSPPLPPPSK